MSELSVLKLMMCERNNVEDGSKEDGHECDNIAVQSHHFVDNVFCELDIPDFESQ